MFQPPHPHMWAPHSKVIEALRGCLGLDCPGGLCRDPGGDGVAISSNTLLTGTGGRRTEEHVDRYVDLQAIKRSLFNTRLRNI